MVHIIKPDNKIDNTRKIEFAIAQTVQLLINERNQLWTRWGAYWIIMGSLFILISQVYYEHAYLALCFSILGLLVTILWYPIIYSNFISVIGLDTQIQVLQSDYGIKIIDYKSKHFAHLGFDKSTFISARQALHLMFVIVSFVWFLLSLYLVYSIVVS